MCRATAADSSWDTTTRSRSDPRRQGSKHADSRSGPTQTYDERLPTSCRERATNGPAQTLQATTATQVQFPAPLKLPSYGTIQIRLLLLLLLLFFKANQHKAAGRKTKLDIQNYGCNGNLLCDHGAVERNHSYLLLLL